MTIQFKNPDEEILKYLSNSMQNIIPSNQKETEEYAIGYDITKNLDKHQRYDEELLRAGARTIRETALKKIKKSKVSEIVLIAGLRHYPVRYYKAEWKQTSTTKSLHLWFKV